MSDPAPRLTLLLDAHLPLALADALRRAGIEADHVATWRGGALRPADDRTLLREAARAGRAFVTRDTSTVPPEAFALIGDGEPTGGVIVISSRIRADDVSAHLAALVADVARRPTAAEWRDVVSYAARSRET